MVIGAGKARAIEEWTGVDVLRQSVFTSLVMADWVQTRLVIGPTCTEANPILGRCPSARRIDLAAGSAILGHASVAALLPRPWRQMWQMLGITIEGLVVTHNLSAGASFTF